MELIIVYSLLFILFLSLVFLSMDISNARSYIRDLEDQVDDLRSTIWGDGTEDDTADGVGLHYRLDKLTKDHEILDSRVRKLFETKTAVKKIKKS